MLKLNVVKIVTMKELLSTNDIVLLSFTRDLLGQEGIEHVVLDENMSILEGSVGILPLRIMVAEEDYHYASRIIAIEPSLQEKPLEDPIDKSLLTDDGFLNGAVDVYQLKDGFRSGIDAVLLGASVPDSGNLRVLDAGCGVGVVSLCIASRCLKAQIDGIEIEPKMAKIAEMNFERNELDDRLSLFNADLTQPISKLEKLGLARQSYDYVVANPPYYDEGAVINSKNPLKRRANSGDQMLLEEWMRFMTAMVVPGGKFLMIHLADKLPEILSVAERRFGEITVFPIFSKEGDPATRVIVRGRKGSKGPFKLLPGMVLHGDGDGFSRDASAILTAPLHLKID